MYDGASTGNVGRYPLVMTDHEDGCTGPVGEAAVTSDPELNRSLDVLWSELVSARDAVAEARQGPQGLSNMTELARRHLVTALEAYTAALQAQNLPVPYRLRDDLRLQRRALEERR